MDPLATLEAIALLKASANDLKADGLMVLAQIPADAAKLLEISLFLYLRQSSYKEYLALKRLEEEEEMGGFFVGPVNPSLGKVETCN